MSETKYSMMRFTPFAYHKNYRVRDLAEDGDAFREQAHKWPAFRHEMETEFLTSVVGCLYYICDYVDLRLDHGSDEAEAHDRIMSILSSPHVQRFVKDGSWLPMA